MRNHRPKIDAEFKSLIPPLAPAERQQLEANIRQHGCRDPLTLWRGVLLDGHNRLDICTRHRLPYRTVNIDLPDRAAAIEWMVRNQFGRRSLTPFVRAELALRLQPSMDGRRRNDGNTLTTRDAVARVAGMSGRTLGLVKVIQREGSKGLKDKLRRGHITISAAYRQLRRRRIKPPLPIPTTTIPTTGRRLCVCDPPYPGLAHKHYSADPRCDEVDHAKLIRQLERDYDAWALCTASTTLQTVLAVCPKDVRIGAWVKSWVPFRRGVNPAYAWEAVIFRTPNRQNHQQPVKDYVECPTSQRTGLVGSKPEAFCMWVFDLLGAQPGDELHDLFPGTGAVTKAWEKYRRKS